MIDPFLKELVRVFKHWSSPRDGKLFEHHLLREIEVGRLSDAWNAKKQELTDLTQQVTSLQQQVEQGAQPFATPNGYQPDAADGAAMDDLLASAAPLPTPPEVPGT